MSQLTLKMIACAIVAAFLFAAWVSSAQTASQLANERVYQAELNRERAFEEQMQQEAEAEAADAQQAEQEQRRAQVITATLQTDPWRVVDGTTQHVAVTWCAFSGKVLQTSPDGVRVDGRYASIYPDGAVSFSGEFFVKHFPYTLADNDPLPPYVAAVPDGVYTYTTVMNADRSIHCLDFGIPCDKPQWAIDAETNRPVSDAAAMRAKGEARALAANEASAAKNDPFGLLRMGERYRDGDGVPKDLGKARAYLTRAANAGEITASNELAALPQAAPAQVVNVQVNTGR